MSQETSLEKATNTPPDTDDEIVEFVEESEYEEVNEDFDFNSSEGSSEPVPAKTLQREASRQSLMSTTSDAYSLPVGAQDDVSSLEHEDDDDDEDDDDEDSNQAGGTKLAETSESELQGSATFSFLAASKRSSLTVTPEKTSHDIIGGPSPAKLQARREAYMNSKQRGSALQLSHSNLGDIPLVEGDNETHADDDTNTMEEKSKDAASLDLDDLGSIGTEEKPSKDVDQLTLRLHQSLFIPFSESDLMTPTAGPNRSNSAQEFQRPNSLDMEDADEILARNLPPELDLNEARKYIAQLAHGVPEKPLFTTPHRSSSTPNANNRGHLTGSSFHRRNMLHSAGRSSAMSSEYTEIVVEDDQDPSLRRTLGFSPALRTPLSHSRYFTTTPSSHIASASGHFSEYTEIVIEDESESSPMASSSHRKMYSNRESSLSHDFSELVEYEEEEVIEEIIEESFH